MQGMKADAASCRIIHRVGQQMIDIDEHGRAHRHPGTNEFLAEKHRCNNGRDQDVKAEMQVTSNHVSDMILRRKKKAAQKLGGIVSKRCIRPGWNQRANHPDINVMTILPVLSQYLRSAASAG